MTVRQVTTHGLTLLLAWLCVAVLGVEAQAQTPGDRQTPRQIAPNACELAFNNRCDDRRPGGTGLCPLGGDFADCEGRDGLPHSRATLFGFDDRRLFDTAEMPWRTIGEFRLDSGGRCSGVLIAEDVVLTAAHCIIRLGAIVSDGEFVTARGRVQGPAQARVIDAHVLQTVRADPGLEDYYRENRDWALLKLDRPIGAEIGYLAIEAVSDNRPLRRDLISFIALAIITFVASFALKGLERRVLQLLAGAGLIVLGGFALNTVFGADPRLERVWQAGYSADTGTNLSGSDNCSILEFRASGLIGHNCDTVPGDSGSPLLVRRGEDWAIIALVSHSRSGGGSLDVDLPGVGQTDRAYAVSSSVVPDPDTVFGTDR